MLFLSVPAAPTSMGGMGPGSQKEFPPTLSSQVPRAPKVRGESEVPGKRQRAEEQRQDTGVRNGPGFQP